MATEKWVARLEAKLDALLEKNGLKPADFDDAPATARQGLVKKLSPAEQQAIDNAPKTPTGAQAPAGANKPRVDAATNAPSTAMSVPPDAVGNVTVETEQPDGETTVDTMPASEAKATYDPDFSAPMAEKSGSYAPWATYDSDSDEAIVTRLRSMAPAERNKALAYERKNKNRATITRVNWNSGAG